MNLLQRIFSHRTTRRFLKRTRYLWFVLVLVPFARYIRPELMPLAIGVSAFGQLIQAWCFASLVKDREVSIRGPYLMVRNPMYLGRFFLILGLVLLLGNAWIALGYTVLYYAYMYYRVKREEARLRRRHGEEYEAFCRKVRRFLPSLGALRDPHVRFFNKGMFLENNGHWNIVLTIVVYAAVYAVHRVWPA
ncbi:MAG: isoprenylcysteine carboxylmethyltransferase family protein [bacterium]|nr:isoprenylcysteine carboxylmethyltransferase family protein [bacterium]